jgi:hypothetical protein
MNDYERELMDASDRRAQAAIARMKWLPIESAPRDGTWILVFSPDGTLPGVARWNFDVQRFVSDLDYDEDDNLNSDAWANDWRVDWWMPLPEPPTAELERTP